MHYGIIFVQTHQHKSWVNGWYLPYLFCCYAIFSSSLIDLSCLFRRLRHASLQIHALYCMVLATELLCFRLGFHSHSDNLRFAPLVVFLVGWEGIRISSPRRVPFPTCWPSATPGTWRAISHSTPSTLTFWMPTKGDILLSCICSDDAVWWIHRRLFTAQGSVRYGHPFYSSLDSSVSIFCVSSVVAVDLACMACSSRREISSCFVRYPLLFCMIHGIYAMIMYVAGFHRIEYSSSLTSRSAAGLLTHWEPTRSCRCYALILCTSVGDLSPAVARFARRDLDIHPRPGLYLVGFSGTMRRRSESRQGTEGGSAWWGVH